MPLTLNELEVMGANAEKAGDYDAARKIAAVINREISRQESDPEGFALEQIGAGSQDLAVGETMPQEVDPTLGQRAVGALETGIGALAGGAAGAIGQLAGRIEGAIREITTGQTGTGLAEEVAQSRGQQLSQPFAPKSAEGQRQTEILGDALSSLGALPPFVPGGSVLATMARPAASLARDAAKGPVAAAKEAIKKPIESMLADPQKPGPESGGLSVGAAETGQARLRADRSKAMPVPFEGGSELTKGQATRDYEQLQFEKETAKLADVGEPLRDRVENQTSTLISNFDALADRSGPIKTELRDIGLSVDEALVGRLEREKRKVDNLYNMARAEGQLRDPVQIERMGLILDDITKFEDLQGVGGLVRGAKAYASKNKIVDDEGAPLPVSIEDAERFRQWINDATDLTDARQSRVRRIMISAVDDATENAGGDVYQQARRARAKMSREFENTGITKKLLSTKKGTDERSIAYEDAFKKVFLDSPIEEINKLRGTLLRSGEQGKQAWADMKGKGIEYIKESALSASQKDSKGNSLLSPDKLNRVIMSLDQKGKLDSIYGKKNAEIIRDLGDIAIDIYTAPPGAINFSNTASALQVALDSMGSFAVTGIPAPIALTLKEASRFMRDSKKKKRINDALTYLRNQPEK